MEKIRFLADFSVVPLDILSGSAILNDVLRILTSRGRGAGCFGRVSEVGLSFRRGLDKVSDGCYIRRPSR